VTSAAITDDGGIELVTDFKALSHVITSRYAKGNANQFRAMSNKDEKNVYSALDGKLRSGVPTPIMSRCSKAGQRMMARARFRSVLGACAATACLVALSTAGLAADALSSPRGLERISDFSP